MAKCRLCKGSGSVPAYRCGYNSAYPIICPRCHSTGEEPTSKIEKCSFCNGRRSVPAYRSGYNSAYPIICPRCHSTGEEPTST